MKELKGLVAPQLVPMKNNGEIDFRRYSELSEYLISSGVDGIFVCGTTGEFPNLTIKERKQLLDATAEVAELRAYVLYNITALNLNDIKDLATYAYKNGADAVSITPPYYYKYDDMALVEYFCRSIEFCGDLPVYLYNIPGMVKNKISTYVLKEVCKRCPTVKGIKDSSMDYMTFLEFQNVKPNDGFKVITGNDAQVLTCLMAGEDSAVIAFAGVIPEIAKGIFTDFKAGHIDSAKRKQNMIMELRSLARDISPISSHKEMLKQLGFDMGPCRFPIRELNVSEKDRISEKLRNLGLIGGTINE